MNKVRYKNETIIGMIENIAVIKQGFIRCLLVITYK